VLFSGDPLEDTVSTDPAKPAPTCPTTQVACSNKDFLLQRQLRTFQAGPRAGSGPEVNDEEIVPAMILVRANTMVYEAATPQVTQSLLDLLNKRIAPVVQSRGTPGEGDLPQMSNVEGTMVGAYWMNLRQVRGRRLGLPRNFGTAPTAAFNAFRQVVPWQMDPTQRPNVPPGQLAFSFLMSNPASLFYRAADQPVADSARLRSAVRGARARTSRYSRSARRHRASRSFLTTEARSATKK